MEICELEEGLNVFAERYSDMIKNAIVDDFNSESASIIVTYEEDANLRSLNPAIKRFFRYFTGTTVYPNEFARDEGYYMFDFVYKYADADYDFLEALSVGKEYRFINEKRKAEKV